MSPQPGSGTRKLSELLHNLIDFNSHSSTANEEYVSNHPAEENRHMQDPQTTQGTKKSHSVKSGLGLSGVVTTLVSAIALLFSGFSFYETVLKQPLIKLYPPALVHLYRKDYKDILAFPITLSNDGAQRGTVLSFNMEVKNPATGEKRKFENLYFGNDPKDTSRIFTPMTLAGRTSKGDVVMFFATTSGAFFETTGGVPLTLDISLKINLDQSEYWQKQKSAPELKFSVSTRYIQSFRNMEQGNPTVLRLNNLKAVSPPAAKEQPAPADKT